MLCACSMTCYRLFFGACLLLSKVAVLYLLALYVGFLGNKSFLSREGFLNTRGYVSGRNIIGCYS